MQIINWLKRIRKFYFLNASLAFFFVNILVYLIVIPKTNSIMLGISIFFLSFLLYLYYLNKSMIHIESTIKATNEKIKNIVTKMSINGDGIMKASVLQSLSVDRANLAIKEVVEKDDLHIKKLFTSLTGMSSQNLVIEQGIESFQVMSSSIDVIRDYNNKIIFQISKNENEFNKVIEMIRQIDSKSKVISDIAFQSKMLSFNASVEAARAQEHGRGFAVVAEEIENLANSSSQSATEISTLLNISIKQVNDILRTGQQEMGDIVSDALEKIGEGSRNAKNCEELFSRLSDQYLKNNTSLSDIGVSSNEQMKKVEEIKMMMENILKLSKSNEDVVKEYYCLSNELLEQNNFLSSPLSEKKLILA